MYALVVITQFQTYVCGDVITDPDTIAAIEAGPYAGFVTRTMISSDGNGGEALTVVVSLATVGQPVTLSGQTFGSTAVALASGARVTVRVAVPWSRDAALPS